MWIVFCKSIDAGSWDGGRRDHRRHNYSFLHSQLCFLAPWFPFYSLISLKVCSIVGSIHPSIHSHTEAAGGGWSRHNYSKPFSYDWASSCCQAGTKRLSNFFQNHSWRLPILLLPCLLFAFFSCDQYLFILDNTYETFIFGGFECDYQCRAFISVQCLCNCLFDTNIQRQKPRPIKRYW